MLARDTLEMNNIKILKAAYATVLTNIVANTNKILLYKMDVASSMPC